MFRRLCLTLAALAALPAAEAAAPEKKFPDAVLKVLEKADSYELLSLDPETGGLKDGFHGWKVLGKTTVKKKERDAVLDALKKGVADSDGRAAKCFLPRHGVRATHGGKTVDLVICFQCYWMEVYAEKEGRVLTTRSPQPALDKILKDAGVKLAPKEKEVE